MKKYIELMKLQMKEVMEFRANWYLSILAEVLPLPILLLLWMTAFKESGSRYGYNTSTIITYYIISRMISAWIPSVWYEIVLALRTGGLDTFLLKPVSYLGYWSCRQFTTNVFYSVENAIIAVVLSIFFSRYFYIQTDGYYLILMLISLILSFILAYLIDFVLSMTAFWLENSSGIKSIYFLIMTFLSGQIVPLNVLPDFIQRITSKLPFYYINFFPVQIYLGKVTYYDALLGILTEALWIVSFYLIYKVEWKLGLKTYKSMGG